MNQPSGPDLRAIVEFQAIELRRLVKDNDRLNKRVDRLIDELAAFRDLQRQEINLRREDQQARTKVQESLNAMLAKAIEAGGLESRPVNGGNGVNGANGANGRAETVEGAFESESETIEPQPQPQNRSSRRLANWMLVGGLAGGVLGLLSVVSSDPIEAALTMLAACVVGVAIAGVGAVIRTLAAR